MYASEERRSRDSYFCKKISKQGIGIDYFTDDLERMLYGLYSVKHNKVVGYNYDRLIQLANLVLEYNKNYAYVFLWALIEYERKPEIETQDTNRTFKKKVAAYKKERKNNPLLDESKYDALFTLLFPKLEGALRKRK